MMSDCVALMTNIAIDMDGSFIPVASICDDFSPLRCQSRTRW